MFTLLASLTCLASAPLSDGGLSPGPEVAAPPPALLSFKPGSDLTVLTPGGEVGVYGFIDVSFDVATKGIGTLRDGAGSPPVGRVGWLPDMSTNLSYVGLRGLQRVKGFVLVYQLETQVDVTASAGTGETNSNASNVVKGALTTRTSYVGLATAWGTLKAGKSDSPYKLSTDRLNPFAGMLGDNRVIMGNTGGDNRVEFATRLDHSLWYESPRLGPLSGTLLFSPGQNRDWDSGDLAGGESDCTGGNIPGSGGTGGPATGFPIACNDGAFSDAVSASVAFETRFLYVTAAYERHRRVNRSSDIYGIYGAYPLPAAVASYGGDDTADEDAAKVAAQLTLPTGTLVGVAVENLNRYVPAHLEFQNERQRLGWWVAVSQTLPGGFDAHAGWAHAGRTPGDPGQHNTANADIGNGGAAGGTNADNQADLLTAALKYHLSPGILVYLDWATTLNHTYAHYDLGAGGRGVTTDCHDGSLPASGDVNGNPHCWAGGTLMGLSLGMSAHF
jgi:hypothetical protein